MSDETDGQSPAEDDFDRALRELTQGRAGEAKFREPSAAERAKAAKKQARQARKQARPRASGSLALARRQERRRAARKAVSWTVAIALLAGAGLFAWDHFKGKMTGTAAGGAISAIDGQARANGAAALPAPAGPGADPFVAPATLWANGAAGIVVPAANPVGPFTATQVAAAYATTRQLLIAQNLDPATLRGGTPTAFMDLLPTQERQEFSADLNKTGRNKDGIQRSSRAYVASFAPGTTALIGNVIKVHGTMSARVATDRGRTVLDVEVNYRFVYPVEPSHDPANWMRVVGQVTGHEEFNNWEDPGGPLQPWFNAVPSEAGARCDSTDGYIHPEYPVSSPDKVQPSGTPIDPYSMNNLPPNRCFLTTGT